MARPHLPNLVPPPWLVSVRESLARLARPLLATSLVVSGATLGLRHLGWLEFAELAAYDHLVQQQPDRGPDPRLLVVGITETDLQTLQEWPLSDRTLAVALDRLQALEPTAVAVDIFRDFPHEPGHSELIDQLQRYPNILIICKTSAENDLGIPPPPTLDPSQVGFADLVIDPGGILRRGLLLVTPPQPATPFPKAHLCNDYNQTLISLGLRATLLYLQAQGIEPSFSDRGELRLGSTTIPSLGSDTGGYRNADTSGYQILLNYRSETNAVQQVSLMDLLQGRVDGALVRDRIVLVGHTSPQSKDDFYTPFSSARADAQKMPGVVVHAQIASQLLSASLDGSPLIWVWPQAIEGLWIVAWSLAGGLLGWYLRHPAAFGLVVVLGAGGLYASGLVMFRHSGWIPVVPPALTFVGTAGGVVLLDRFSNSAYGKQVYRRVKTLLRIDIEIDEEKLEKQVAEITETDYFRELQEKVKALREGDEAPLASRPQAPPPQPTGSATGAPGLDALGQLLGPPTSVAPAPAAPAATATEADLDFLNDLSREAQQLKRHLGGGALARPTLMIEDNFCRIHDPSEASETYVALLSQEIKKLKQSSGDRSPGDNETDLPLPLNRA
jgi:CHASE2 domain-containing sensor protein